MRRVVMDCCLRVSLVSIVLAIAASAGDPYIPPQCEDVKQMWGLGDDWNRVMANLIAETNVYWVEKALHLFVDVFHADEASTSSTHSLQLSWMALNQSRGSMSFYDASPLVRQPFSTLTGETQAVHVSSAVLREERARSTTDHDVGWRTLVVRLVSSTGHVLGEDRVRVLLVDTFAEAGFLYGFHRPSAEHACVPRVGHLVQLQLTAGHLHQLQALDNATQLSGEHPARGPGGGGGGGEEGEEADCSEVLFLAVKAARQRLERVLLHANGFRNGPTCKRILEHVELVHVHVPVSVYGNAVTWHQHQADVLRLHALRRWGGVYLDTDAIVLRDLGHVMGNKTVVGEQLNGGLCNGVIIAPAGAEFMQRWTAQYLSFSEGKMGLHGSFLPLMLAVQHPLEATLLPPTAMHYPSFTPEGIKALWLGRWYHASESKLVLHLWGSSSAHLHPFALLPDALTGPDSSSPLSCALSAAGVIDPMPGRICSTLSPVPPNPLAADPEAPALPLAYWGFRDGAGKVVRDLTGRGCSGTIYKPRLAPSQLGPTWTEGGEEGGEPLLQLHGGGGGVFLPFLGLFNAGEASVSWKALVRCPAQGCHNQVLLAVHTVRGWMLRVETSASAPPSGSGSGSDARSARPNKHKDSKIDNKNKSSNNDDNNDNTASNTSHVWVEVLLQRHPFTHVLAAVTVPVGVWHQYVLSLSSGAPTVLAVYQDQPSPQGGAKGGRGSEEGGEKKGGEKEGGKAEEGGKEGGGGGGRKLSVDVEAPTTCAWSEAAPDTFLNHCDSDGESAAQKEERKGCALVYGALHEAVTACNARASCKGVTLNPAAGFELRASTQTGVSQSGEVSWRKQLCAPAIATVPPERCLSYTSPPGMGRQCNVHGSGQSFPWLSGCQSRAFVIDSQGRPQRRQAASSRLGAYGEVEWLLALQGCSNDFWLLSMDGIAGIWVGSAEGEPRHAFHGSVHSLAVWDSYWPQGEADRERGGGEGQEEARERINAILSRQRGAGKAMQGLVLWEVLTGAEEMRRRGVKGKREWRGKKKAQDKGRADKGASAEAALQGGIAGYVAERQALWQRAWAVRAWQQLPACRPYRAKARARGKAREHVTAEAQKEEEEARGKDGKEEGAGGGMWGKKKEGVKNKLLLLAGDESDLGGEGADPTGVKRRSLPPLHAMWWAAGPVRHTLQHLQAACLGGGPSEWLLRALKRTIPPAPWEGQCASCLSRRMLLSVQSLMGYARVRAKSGSLSALVGDSSGKDLEQSQPFFSMKINFPRSFSIHHKSTFTAHSLQFDISPQRSQSVKMDGEMEVEVVLDGLMVALLAPPVSRYRNDFHGVWALSRLSELEEQGAIPALNLGWHALQINAVSKDGLLLAAAVAWFQLHEQQALLPPPSRPLLEARFFAAAQHVEQRHASGACRARAPAKALHLLVAEHGVTKVVDLGAGSIAWLQEEEGLGSMWSSFFSTRLAYHAVDLPGSGLEMVARGLRRGWGLRLSYAAANVSEPAFTVAMPDGAQPDLVISRGLLQHLRVGEVMAVLRKLLLSSARFWLVQHNAKAKTNTATFVLREAQLHPLNLALAPFFLDDAVLRLPDECAEVVDGSEWAGVGGEAAEAELLLIDLHKLRQTHHLPPLP